MSRLITLSALITVGVLTVLMRAQADPTAMSIEKIKDNLYVVTGGRQGGGIAGNTTVYVADEGVVLIDTKYSGFGSQILEQVASVTKKPVTMIINTHTHGDHTGGNPEFPSRIEFVSHPNTRANMARMKEFEGDTAAFIPKRTFTDRLTLLGGKNRIELHYFGAGHNNGDAVIVFPELQTAVMGDLFARKWAPLIDADNGGSAAAFPETLAKAIATLGDVQTIITGHATTIGSDATVSFLRSNPIMTPADLREYADFVRELVAAAEAARKAKKTVDEAANELKLPDRYRDYVMTNARADIPAPL